MAKAASPIRLQDELMKAASVVGELQHRSAAEQIEYWASIGRSVGDLIGPDKLLAIVTGLARINVEPDTASPIDPEDVFTTLQRDRDAGVLVSSVSSSPVRYQVSTSHPGQLEQISADGRVLVGQFSNGVFTPIPESAS